MNNWHKILSTAIHAPSPHNVQPWRVKIVDDKCAELFIDSTRTLPKEDMTGSFIISTMGMFIEACRILAAHENLQLDYELFHEPDWYAPAILENKTPTLLPFARLNLTEKETEKQIYNADLFFKRRTSRLKLSPEPVPHAAAESLKNLAAEFHQQYEQTTDAARIERLLQFNTTAMFADMNAAGYHDEIVEWFRFTEKQSLANLDGLDYRCMNTPRLSFWMAARLPFLMQTPVLSNLLARHYRSGIGAVPTLGFLSGAFWEPAAAIETGRFLMRFWLETARHNLYIHPFGNLVTNKTAAALVQEETKIADVWLIFKIGFSNEPPKSHRLPLERILV